MPPSPPLGTVTPFIGLKLSYCDRTDSAFEYVQSHTAVLNLKRDTDSRRLKNEGSQYGTDTFHLYQRPIETLTPVLLSNKTQAS
jgi:hypothetical protein